MADPGTPAQYEDPIEAGFVGEPAGIDLEWESASITTAAIICNRSGRCSSE
jgi:hypothetical protein